MRYDDPETRRLAEDATRSGNWKRWGAYLPERQWGTVREDYSADGDVWRYFPHDHARSRAYRWGEDGLLGITDRQCRLCFALALWNENDPILKERLFGLTNGEGNHGEDAKELWYYLDATPTGSYLRALYKYPQAAFPYARLLEENRRRSRHEPEFEISYMESPAHEGGGHRLLAIPSRERLVRALKYVLDEDEFLSPYGIRSLSRVHEKHPYVFRVGDEEYRVDYAPGDSTTGMFGGNSNWRGPIWLPLNYLLIEALERYDFFYGEDLKVECPTGSGNYVRLKQVAREIAARVERIFMPDERGVLPCWGPHGERLARDPHFRDLVTFQEYFHAEKGWGCGAEHQTGWTSLVVGCIGKIRAKK